MLRHCARPISLFLMFSFLLLSVVVPAAKAEMITTEVAVALQDQQSSRARVAAFLEREEVQQVMREHGIEPAEAWQRVAALSDDEVGQLAQKIDQLPAGGSAVGAIVGAAVFIFVVLLITDLLGLTHVFPFVNR